MGRSRTVVFLLAILVLGLVVAAGGCTSQGPQEQNRPAESQKMPGEEETTEETLDDPAKMMEKTADEEQKAPPS